MEACNPRLTPASEVEGGLAYAAECHEGPRSWFDSVTIPGEFIEAGDLRALQSAMADLIRSHDTEHPQPRERPVRNAKPKFKSGLGMTPGTRITELAPSTSPR